MKTPSSVACSCMRIRSPSSAPPVNGDVGSTASTATRRPAARNALSSAPVTVDLPTPGAPVRPMTRAPPVSDRRSFMTERTWGDSSSTSEISRARARMSPARALSSSASVVLGPAVSGPVVLGPVVLGTVLSGPVVSATGRLAADPEQQGLALAAAAAQPGGAEPSAAPAELVAQVHREPGAGGADRVADGDRAAVDVHDVGADAQVAHGLDGHHRERLVDLDQIQVGYGPPGLGQGLLDGVGG